MKEAANVDAPPSRSMPRSGGIAMVACSDAERLAGMHALVMCPLCAHGATLHEGGGCTVPACACAWTREQVVDDTVKRAKADISNAWR